MMGMVAVTRAHDQKPTAGPVFGGEWRKAEPDGGLTVVKISKQGDRWVAHVWGACTPRDCDWGEQPLALLASAPGASTIDRGFAVWDHGFATSYVTVSVADGRLLAEIVEVYKDKSGRTNFHATERLVRSGS